jgi:hypothetical protein
MCPIKKNNNHNKGRFEVSFFNTEIDEKYEKRVCSLGD